MQKLQAPRRRLFTHALAATMLLATPATALAGPGGDKQVQSGKSKSKAKQKNKGAKGQKRLAKVCAEIGCTEAQQQKLATAMKGFRQATKTDREGIKEARRAMKAEFEKSKPNEKQLRSLLKTISALEANIADERLDLMLEVHGILTPEQRKHGMRLVAGKRHGKGHGKHPGQPPRR